MTYLRKSMLGACSRTPRASSTKAANYLQHGDIRLRYAQPEPLPIKGSVVTHILKNYMRNGKLFDPVKHHTIPNCAGSNAMKQALNKFGVKIS